MRLSISSSGLLALLFLAQSRPATSDFVCNDRSIPDATQGFCLQAINPKPDAKDSKVPPASSYNLIPAKLVGPSHHFKGSNIYTCKSVTILNKPTQKPFCCNYKNKPQDAPFIQSYDEVNKNCITRDGKKLEKPPTQPPQ